jgi:hypothetical protein
MIFGKGQHFSGKDTIISVYNAEKALLDSNLRNAS